jgi:GGDEF domain-containing protein
MKSARRWCLALCVVVLQSAQAVGVTQAVLDLERNPVDTLAQARKGLADTPAAGPEGRARRLELLLQASMAAVMLGDRKTFALHLAEAQDLARLLDDAYADAFCKTLEAGVAGESGRSQEAVTGARNALKVAERIDDPLSRAFIGDMAAWALLSGKQFAEAEPLLRRAIDAYVAQGAVLRRATAQAGMGSLYDGLRDPRSAYRERQVAHDLIRDLDAPYLKAYLTWALGRDALLAGELDKAQGHFETSVQESGRMNDSAGVEVAGLQGLGVVAADRGNWAEALRRLDDVQPRLLAKGYIDLWVLGQAALARAQVELRRGDAEATLASARARVGKMADGSAKLQFLEREAGVMSALGRPQQATQRLAEVLAMERRLHDEARQTQLSELAVRYDLHKKQLENAELRLRSDLAEARLREQATRQQLLVAVLVLGGAVVGLLAFTLFNQVRSRRHFTELALTDALTGAPNRRAILEHLGSLLDSGVPGFVCMLDIDHFKRINDKHGHPVGDEGAAHLLPRLLPGPWRARAGGPTGR